MLPSGVPMRKKDKPALCLLGAVAGDMIVSVYEYASFKSMDFPLFAPDSRFTDDSVLTEAVADAIISHGSWKAILRVSR